LVDTPNVRLHGFHYHIGSQMFDGAGFAVAVSRALNFIAHLRREHGFVTLELDVGGGLGVSYVPSDDPMTIADFAHELRNVIRAECNELGIPIPNLSFEPGRAIVGDSTFTLYEVGTIKPVELDGGVERSYVSVDGGMSDAIRTSLYGAEYTARMANRAPMDVLVQARVVGKHCETGDIVVRDTKLPADLRPGDLLAVATTGAYHYSMASTYNFVPRPAVIAVKAGQARVIVRRETEADLLALHISD
jgi:diaminopimelate decarboxylase